VLEDLVQAEQQKAQQFAVASEQLKEELTQIKDTFAKLEVVKENLNSKLTVEQTARSAAEKQVAEVQQQLDTERKEKAVALATVENQKKNVEDLQVLLTTERQSHSTELSALIAKENVIKTELQQQIDRVSAEKTVVESKLRDETLLKDQLLQDKESLQKTLETETTALRASEKLASETQKALEVEKKEKADVISQLETARKNLEDLQNLLAAERQSHTNELTGM
jgi:hypothetical protein